MRKYLDANIIENTKVNNLKQVKEILNKYNENDEVIIKIKHNNKRYVRKAKLIKYKNSIIMGVGIVELNELITAIFVASISKSLMFPLCISVISFKIAFSAFSRLSPSTPLSTYKMPFCISKSDEQ